MAFEYLDHTADVRLKLSSENLENLFRDGILAFRDIISKAKPKKRVLKVLEIEGNTKESILFNLFDELIFIFDTSFLIPLEVEEIKLYKNKLLAKVWFGKIKEEDINTYIKAVTFYDLKIKKEKGKFTATVVFDI